MKAILLTGYGDLEKNVFSLHHPLPTPSSSQVLLKVVACGINNTDIWTRKGAYSDKPESQSGWRGLKFPRIQGADVCGKIVEVGESIDRRRIGERVIVYPAFNGPNGLVDCNYLGSELDGGFAEYCVVESENAIKIHDSNKLTDIEIAAIPTAYMTAYHMMKRVNLVKDQRVIITGASGGVGVALVQLCKYIGAYVIAIVSPEKADEVKRIGADEVLFRDSNVDKTLEKLGETNPVHSVLDVVAGDLVQPLLKALKYYGKYASAGAISNPFVNVHWPTFYLKHLDLLGCLLATREEFMELLELFDNGDIKPLVSKVFPLKDLSEAQSFFLKKNFIGKLVINCQDDSN